MKNIPVSGSIVGVDTKDSINFYPILDCDVKINEHKEYLLGLGKLYWRNNRRI